MNSVQKTLNTYSKASSASLTAHAGLAFFLFAMMSLDRPQIQGEAGKSGFLHTRYTLDITVVPTPHKTVPKKILTSNDGIVIAEKFLPKKLPEEVKTTKPVVKDEIVTRQSSEKLNGDTLDPKAPIGAIGQGGSGNAWAEKIGNGDHTNELGLILKEIHEKTQAALGSAGYVKFSKTANLDIYLNHQGFVTRIRFTKSTGDADLDSLAVEAIQKAQPFLAVTKLSSDKIPDHVTIPVIFKAN